MSPTSRTIASILNAEPAYRLAELIQDELIPVDVVCNSARWEVKVPLNHVDRALSILSTAQISELELAYLATGRLVADDDSV